MGKTLYVSDLDGTLLQPGARLSEKTVATLNDAISNGALFTIATARTPATVAPIIEKLDLRLPAIVMTGAAMWSKQTGEYSELRYMDRGAVEKLLEIYRSQRYPTFYFTIVDNQIHIYHTGPVSGLEREFIDERVDSPYKTFHVPASGESETPKELDRAILFYGFQPDAMTAGCYALTSKVEGCRVSTYHDIYGPEIGILEAFAPDATKAEAIRSLAARLGADRIVAFGDNINDIPMLETADTGVAVENAIPEVRAMADVVIGPNTEDSVAAFIAAEQARGIDRPFI